MRRYALIILVLVILLLNSLMQRAAEANPLTDDLWEWRFDLPAGAAAAGLCIAVAGLGAQFWRGVLPLCGAEWAPTRFWTRLGACALWCGWLPLLCAQPYTLSKTSHLAAGQPSHGLVAAFVALVLCRMLGNLSAWGWGRLVSALAAAGAALTCGLALHMEVTLCPLAAALAAAPALRLLSARENPPQMVWLLVAGLAFCAYAAAFGQMVWQYAPGPWEASTAGMWLGGFFSAAALALAILRPLRHSVAGRRVLSLLTLAAGAVWIGLEMAPPHPAAAAAIFVATLALLGLSAAMMAHRSH